MTGRIAYFGQGGSVERWLALIAGAMEARVLAFFVLQLVVQLLVLSSFWLLAYLIVALASLLFIICLCNAERVRHGVLLAIFFSISSLNLFLDEFHGAAFMRKLQERNLPDEPELFEGRVIEDYEGMVQGSLRMLMRGRFSFSNYTVNVMLSMPDVPWRSEANISLGSSVRCKMLLRLSSSNQFIDKARRLQNGYVIEAELPKSGAKEYYCRVVKEDPNNQLRIYALAEKLYIDLSSNRYASRLGLGVILAATTGRGAHLETWVSELFKESGLYHLLVVSGYHLGVLMAIAFACTNILLRYRVDLLVWTSKKNFLFYSGLVFSFLFVSIGTLRPPLLRALSMLIVASFGRLLERRASICRSILYSLIVLHCIWPLCIFSAGVQLSYMALFGVLTGVQILERLKGRLPGADSLENLYQLFFASMGASVFVLPVQWFWFSDFSPYALFFNVLFAPLFSFVVVGGGIMLVFLYALIPMLARPLLVAHSQITECIIKVIDYVYYSLI